MDTEERSDPNANVALWGAYGSGKTWLLNAFGKELAWYNENDPQFEYLLKDIDDNYLLFTEPLNTDNAPPTDASVDHLWTFERHGKLKNSRAHQISSHAHRILVHDNPGQVLVNVINGDESNDIVFSALQNSPNLILLLDPTNVKGGPIASSSSQLTKSDYERLLGMLVEIVLQKNSQVRIAVCLSKSDLVKIHLPTEEIIRVVFGDGALRSLNSPRVDKAFFRVSSVGIFRKGGKRLSNLTDGQALSDPDHWNPLNVVAPFFWIFEAIERQRISEGDWLGDRNKIYIPYPPPREG
jgi:GTPase SAR1 family protein